MTSTQWPAPARAALWNHLHRARWYGGKGRPGTLSAIIALPWLAEPTATGPGVRPEIAVVTHDDRVDHYQLLLAYGKVTDSWGQVEVAGHGLLAVGDACADVRARHVLWQAMIADGDHGRGEQGSELMIRTDPALADHVDAEVTVFGGEQSNTSLMIGDRLLLKLFRRLEPGRNLDVERHRDLARVGSGDVAALHGWVEGRWTDEGGARHDVDLAMIIEQFAAARDGWTLALEACAAGNSFTGEARELGGALRRVHASLGATRTTIDGAALADRLEQQLADHAVAAAALIPYTAGLSRHFAALRGRSIDVQPVHGDLHLGQVLHTRTGWKVIDFEGEPVKSAQQRRQPDAPWRDVAGILRSLSYAAATSAAEVGDEPARAWAEEAGAAFLAGYRPGGLAEQEQDVLTACVADRAAYEVVYETRNRPDWVAIPLRDVAALATNEEEDAR
ncbi:maltokinase N-terminal cap-like domain-containing protein [Propionibacteriaceae bacterium Y1700]|uniref:maltokinase N-terminal cap-like domain-containing protein n=1 Tax=Microlunatus sp. Y1700 TaxID=3418487 RepID=UPI003DA76B03